MIFGVRSENMEDGKNCSCTGNIGFLTLRAEKVFGPRTKQQENIYTERK